jgi:BirA family biotin operon repressor/biotin-[acetyl-CoA-carboxylase] ligase
LLTEHTVVEAARSAGLSSPVHFLEVTGSTNTDLLHMAEQGAPDWTLVVAGQQDGGRGRLGRTWVSAPGASLLVSLLVRPALPAADVALVTLATGACMASACLAACGVEARCKWPNDIVIGGRKLGGILVEAKVQGDHVAHAVIGVGVNVKQGASDFPPELKGSATSVAMEGGRPDLLGLLCEFLVRMRRFCNPADPDFGPNAVHAYRLVCDTIGRTVRATTTSGHQVEGQAIEVADSGELVVATPSGPERIGFGEIAHLD